MPGMMDTILNLGLNPETVEGLGHLTNNKRFAFDSYRRFVQLFGKIALGVSDELYDHAMNKIKADKKVKHDTDLDADDLKVFCLYTFKTNFYRNSPMNSRKSPRRPLASLSLMTPSSSSKLLLAQSSAHGWADVLLTTARSSRSHPRWQTALL